MKGAEHGTHHDRLHCSSPDRGSKAQAEVQTQSENLLSHLHLSYHTWSDGRKPPQDTDQFVSSEAFMKKVKTCPMMAELAFAPG